jgi:tRNA 2-thiouridine synthesizing protein E
MVSHIEEDRMPIFTFRGRNYPVDDIGFLKCIDDWDRAFAEGMAPGMDIPTPLTEAHWKVIRFIRESCRSTGRCPLVYQTCRANGLSLRALQELFPTGYLRGACKAAGLTYQEADLSTALLRAAVKDPSPLSEGKSYRIDVFGFLVDPSEWDEVFAVRLAQDLKLAGGLKESHWRVLRFLREAFHERSEVPTVYATCHTLGLELGELEELFPDGYHRGAVRMAGLNAR